MTPTEFRAALVALRWSRRGLADALGRHPSTVDQWGSGRARVPADVAAWLSRAARWHRSNPPPGRESGAASQG